MLFSCFNLFFISFRLNHDQVHSCLRSTIKIIRFIHNEVKLLESFLQSTKKLENKYEPLEELYDCTYFQQNIEHFSADDFKVYQ